MHCCETIKSPRDTMAGDERPCERRNEDGKSRDLRVMCVDNSASVDKHTDTDASLLRVSTKT